MDVLITAKNRRKYSTEFKPEAIRLLEDSSLTLSEVSCDLDIHRTTLRA